MSHRAASWFTRCRAWWLGLDSADNLQRYGSRSVLGTIWREWRGSLLVVGCAFTFMVGQQQSSRANEILTNIELNRQRHYGRRFAPEYVASAAGRGVYDGPQGYSHVDSESGLLVNADNRLTTDLSAAEQADRVRQSSISPEMMQRAQRLLDSPRYSSAKSGG